MNFSQLQEALRTKSARLQELTKKYQDIGLSDAEKTEAATLPGELAALKADYDAAVIQIKAANEAAAFTATLSTPVAPAPVPTATTPQESKSVLDAFNPAEIDARRPVEKFGIIGKFSIPDGVRRPVSKSKVFGEVERAYGFSQWFLATRGNQKSYNYCKNHGVEVKFMNEGENAAGGYLVPDQFLPEIILLREMFGKFRNFTNRVPISGDTVSMPRSTNDLSTYFVGEGVAPTESELTFDQVRLTVKKLAALVKLSSELLADAAVPLADFLARRLAWSIAKKEDQCGFIGDGTSTYGGMIGATVKLKTLSATRANIAGLRVASGGVGWDGIDLDDFVALLGLLPDYADTPNVRWFMHRYFFYNKAVSLAKDRSGVTMAEIIDGQRTPVFLGYPVEFIQVMSKVSTATDTIPVLFGDLSLASSMAEREEFGIATSDQFNFSQDLLAVRGLTRFYIENHDYGNVTATEADKEPGPVVGIITAA